METIKVLLGDPRHHTVGVHSTYVPIGIGYIATYLTAIIPTQNFEVKISVNPDEILKKGYAIIWDSNRQIIKNTKSMPDDGSQLEIQMIDGNVKVVRKSKKDLI